MKQKFSCLLLALVLALGLLPGTTVSAAAADAAAPAVSLPFADVTKDDAAYTDIAWAFENGVLLGSGGAFTKDGAATRQQVWMALARLAGETPAGMGEARAWAMTNGLTDGTNPAAKVTRQQLAAMLYRCALLKVPGTAAAKPIAEEFPDYKAVAPYARAGFSWTVLHYVFSESHGKLQPTASVTRGELAAALHALAQHLA